MRQRAAGSTAAERLNAASAPSPETGAVRRVSLGTVGGEKMHRYLAGLVIRVLLISGFSRIAAAGPTTFTIGVEDYPNFLPYSSYHDNTYAGLGRDMLDAFARERGYTFVYQVYPLKRRDNLFVLGKVDFAFPDNPNWVVNLKRQTKISYAPMLEFTDGVLVRREHMGHGVARLKALGIPLGFTPYPYQQLMSAGALRVEESMDYDSLYEKLIASRIDGAYMNTRIAKYYWSTVRGESMPPVSYDPDLPHASGYWYLSSIKYPDVVAEFRSFLATHKAEMDALKAHYGFESSGE